MKSTTEATYLCSVITNTPDPGQEIRRRIFSTMPVFRRPDIFWNETRSNRMWKLLVYKSVMVSCVLSAACHFPTKWIAQDS